MKTKLLFLISFVFIFFKIQGQTPSNSCSNPPILQVDTEYTINNLDVSQFGFGTPIQGHSSNGNNVRGFWLRVEVPLNYYATEIKIYNVSSNFDPVIGLKSNCSYDYYPNTNNSHDYADSLGNGGSETFGTGLTGPDSIGDGIYHIRLYHYNPTQTPTVSFKIKITGHYTNQSFDLEISNQSVSNLNPSIGDQINLSCHQNYSGSCGCSSLSPNPKVGYFLSSNSTYESSNDTLLGNDSSSIGDNDTYDSENMNWTIPSSISAGNYYILFVADYNNQHSESNEGNNTQSVAITINSSSCTGVSITQQPTNQTVTSGNSATFSVSATGTPTISYQWVKNGSNISGATSSTYTTPSLNTSDNGNTYKCKVTNCDGTVISNIASVTVSSSCNAVGISQHPQNQTANVGNTATFSVTASGTSPFSYQWKKNGSNISGATSSTYTTPSLSLSNNNDQYRCSITNCSGNYSTISNIAYLTVNSITPSNILIENVITGNSSFSNPKLLWQGTTDSSSDVIKICADGSEVTRFTFTNNTSIPTNNIKFRLLSNQNGADIEKNGTFNDSHSNDVIIAKLTHPKYFNSNNSFRDDTIQIYNVTNNSIIYSIPIRIYKAPVLMVHGLWGDASSFLEMKNYLINNGHYPNELLMIADYSRTNDYSFNQNSNIVKAYSTLMLKIARLHKYSAGKIDIIAHSMGGILSRIYLQSNGFTSRNDINKLITLNTPHSGSPFGNLLNHYNTFQLIPINLAIKAKFGYHKSIHNGAVEDLGIGSTAINNLNGYNGNTFSDINIIPSHSVKSVFDLQSLQPTSIWYYFYQSFYHMENTSQNLIDWHSNLFNDVSNDIIVSTSSQSVGLNGNSTSYFYPQYHIGSPNNSQIKEKVLFLLNQNSNSSNFSTQLHPQNINPPALNTSRSFNTNQMVNGSISIINPTNNQTFNAGETINIDVSSINGIDKILLSIISKQDNIGDLFTANSSSASFSYTIPTNTYEKLHFIVSGFSGNNLIDYDTLTVNVTPNSYVQNISVLQESIMIPNNYAVPISLFAHRSNGISHIISDYENIQYQVNDNNIAEYYTDNLIKGNSIGSTSITITYEGHSVTVPITVFESDDSLELPDILSVIENQIENNNNLLKIYPNPNDGSFIIQFNSYSGENINISIYNNIGKKVLSLKDKSENNLFRKNISLEGLTNGIYYIRASMGDKHKVGKIIINK